MGPALTRLGEAGPNPAAGVFEAGTGQNDHVGHGRYARGRGGAQPARGSLASASKTSVPKVPYKENRLQKTAPRCIATRSRPAAPGKFAEVHMEVRTLERGSGFEYSTDRIFRWLDLELFLSFD